MPMYSFKCPVCGRKKTVTRPMSESDVPVLCACRRTFMDRDFKADLPHAASDRYDNPIVSSSMAINPEQIAEHKATFPDIEVTPEGCPVFDNYSQHEAYLKKTGFVKHPGKKKNNSGKTVYKFDWYPKPEMEIEESTK